MAKYSANPLVNYFLAIPENNKEALASIRLWKNLKAGTDNHLVWIKDLEEKQINSLEVKSLPVKTIYYEKENKLYLLHSLLPDQNIPSVLWTPIDRFLQVKLPSFNHNYFGINEKIKIKIVQSNTEQEAEGMITTLTELNQFIQSAPAFRLSGLKWVILNNNKVCIMGKPILPIMGEVFWKKNLHLLPAGNDFEFPVLSDELNCLLNADHSYYVLWKTDNTYSLIERHYFKPLSISSFRLSLLKKPFVI